MESHNEWWRNKDNHVDTMMEQSRDEYRSAVKDFRANITEAMLNALENELIIRRLDLTFEKKPNNIITVRGDHENVNGTELLDAFRGYDPNARPID